MRSAPGATDQCLESHSGLVVSNHFLKHHHHSLQISCLNSRSSSSAFKVEMVMPMSRFYDDTPTNMARTRIETVKGIYSVEKGWQLLGRGDRPGSPT
jgi:hypothetical protein